MGYIAALVCLVVLVPLLFVLFSRRPPRGGLELHERGVTPSEPAADAPTPGEAVVNRPRPGVEKRLPPG